MSKYQKLNTNSDDFHKPLSSKRNLFDDKFDNFPMTNTENESNSDATTISGSFNYHHSMMMSNSSDNYSNSSNLTFNNPHATLTTMPIDLDDEVIDIPLLSNNNNDQEQLLSETTHSPHIRNASIINNSENVNHQHYNDFNDDNSSSDTLSCHCGQPGFSTNLINKSTQEAKLRILCAISLCGIFMIIEFIGGYLAHSLAIMTDAAHLASDCISFIIGLVAIWLGSRPPDKRMSFGYKRMEIVGAIGSILGIWILTGSLVLVAIQRIMTNDYDLNADAMMIISGIGIIINILMVFVLHGSVLLPNGTQGHCHHTHHHHHNHQHHHHNDDHSHSHGHKNNHSHEPQTDFLIMANGSTNGSSLTQQNGLKQSNKSITHNNGKLPSKNVNLRAAMIHVIGDLVQSIGVFLASIFIKIYPSAKIADPLCTVLFSIIVIMTTLRLFKESVGILLDAVPENISVYELEMDLSHIEGVKSVHHLNVWNHTTDYSVMMVHLKIDFLADSNTILNEATLLANSNKYNIKHCTIQIERLSA